MYIGLGESINMEGNGDLIYEKGSESRGWGLKLIIMSTAQGFKLRTTSTRATLRTENGLGSKQKRDASFYSF